MNNVASPGTQSYFHANQEAVESYQAKRMLIDSGQSQLTKWFI